MTLENRIPSLSRAQRILEKLAQIAQDVSVSNAPLPESVENQLSSAIVSIQSSLKDLGQEMAQTQQQVREEFESVLNRSGEAYLALDRGGRYQAVNTVAAQEIFHRPAAEVLGHTYQEIPPGVDGQVFNAQFATVFDLNRPVRFITQSPSNDRTYEVRGYPRENLIELIMTDISERIQAESERDHLLQDNRQHKELLEAVLQQMPAGVTLVDVGTHKIIMQNQQNAEIIQHPLGGLSIEEQFSLVQGYHLDGQRYQEEEWPLYRAIHAGEVVENEEICIGPNDGSERYISVNAAPIFGLDGKIDAAVSIIFDITERHRAELNNRFLAQFGERVMRLEDTSEISGYAVRALGEYLHVARCTLDEITMKERSIVINHDYAHGYPSMVGHYSLSPLHDQLAGPMGQGKILINDNTATDPLTEPLFNQGLSELGIYAFVAVPRFKEDQWTGTLIVMDDRPREWRADEISLLRSSADMLWLALEGAKLLKDLEVTTGRFNVALMNAPIMLHSLDRNLRYKWVYKPPANFSIDEVLGKRYDELVPPEQVRELMELKQSVLASGESTRKEVHTHLDGQEQIMDVTLEPLRDAWGAVTGLTVAGIDITGQRRLEAEVVDNMTQIEIQHEILRHREMERMEVARDLHDGPLQELIGLNFAISEISLISDEAEREQSIQQIQEMLQRQIQDLRAFCYELRPPALTPFGFERAIRSHLEQFERKYPHLKVHVDLMHDAKTLPEDLRLALFRAYQEALNNVVRHSEAKEVWITFRFDDQRAELEIRDNGKGFQVPQQWLQLAREGHLGMVGMHERVEAVGGRIDIISALGEGTRVKVTVPVGAERAD